MPIFCIQKLKIPLNSKNIKFGNTLLNVSSPNRVPKDYVHKCVGFVNSFWSMKIVRISKRWVFLFFFSFSSYYEEPEIKCDVAVAATVTANVASSIFPAVT